MSSFISIPQFLAPRGIPASSARFLALRNNAGRQRQRQLLLPTAGETPFAKTSLQQSSRFSTTSPTSAKAKKSSAAKKNKSAAAATATAAPPTLEKPDKFRPPSHPARRVVNPASKSQASSPLPPPKNYPGPPRSGEEIEASNKKWYPNSFPPEGTVMYRFLTNRGIHIWISLSILFSLATFTFTTNFKQTSPYADLLPAWSGLLTSPFSTLSQVMSVYKMHTEHVSVQTAEKRKRRVDDVEKRREYRVAHGLEEPQERDLAKKDGEGEGNDGEAVVRRQPKRWFGIW